MGEKLVSSLSRGEHGLETVTFCSMWVLAADLLMKRFELETSIVPSLAQFSRVP
jgi:hypothetical protein